MTSARLSIGIDFGTESARAVLVDCADGNELGDERRAVRHGVVDARLPGPDGDVELEPDWALQDPETTSRASRSRCRPARRGRRARGRGRGRRHRLHLVHDAAHARRRHARSAPSRSCAGRRTHGRSCGSTTPPSRRPTGSTRSQPGGASLAAPLRREDLVRVVLRQGAADPRGGARDVCVRRAADRSVRLDRLAAHRRGERNAARRATRRCGRSATASPRRRTSRRSTRGSRTWSPRSCRGRSCLPGPAPVA